ncbi:MAG: hypothetical protein E3J81_00245 [Dehalococcoidia bacterium]|nr:MAG: hypothetical protein E3J81_00245 [Dehalococcoidia bacterium]
MVASINWGKAPQLACWDKPAFCAVGRTLSWLWPLPLVITAQVISSTRILAALAMFPGKTNSRKTTGTYSQVASDFKGTCTRADELVYALILTVE